MNDALSCTFFDCRAAALEGRRIHEILPKSVSDACNDRRWSVLASGETVTEIRMLRGLYCRAAYLPIHEVSDGPMVHGQIAVADPVSSRLIDSRMARTEVSVRVEYSPLADLGPFEVLMRDDLRMLRQLADGWNLEEMASSRGVSTPQMSDRLEWIGSTLEWGDLRGLRSHAFACGLHLFDEDYFARVILPQLPE